MDSVDIGFTEDHATVTEGSSDSVCVAILMLEPQDIKPMQNIHVGLSVSSENINAGIYAQYIYMHV